MIPVPAHLATKLLDGEFGTRRSLALNHAARLGQDGFWADRRADPRCLVLQVSDEEGIRSFFAAGEPGPAISWLVEQTGHCRLMGPPGWGQAMHERLPGGVEPENMAVRFRPEGTPPPAPALPAKRVRPSSSKRFEAAVPAWAWRSWGSSRACLEQGAAYALYQNSQVAAVAWIIEEDDLLAGIGVFTVERYRRLGLGRAVTLALLNHLSKRRRRCPVWAASRHNEPSLALASSLGFSLSSDELVVCWSSPDPGGPSRRKPPHPPDSTLLS